jgi:hypothetical protein
MLLSESSECIAMVVSGIWDQVVMNLWVNDGLACRRGVLKFFTLEILISASADHGTPASLVNTFLVGD